MTIISAFVGSLVLSIEIGPVHLFPFRFFLFIICSVFLITIIIVNNGRLNLAHIKVKLFLQFLALWFCDAFVSMLWAAEKTDAIKNIIFLFTGISLVFFMVYFFRKLSNLKILFWLFIFIFIALLPLGIWETYTGNHLENSKMFEADNIRSAFSPTAVFFNPNDYAAYIVLTLPMLLVWLRYTHAIIGRILLIVATILGLWLLLMTFARSCYIAFLMGFSFWLIFFLPLKKTFKISILMLILLIGFISVFPSEFEHFFKTAEDQMSSLALLASDGQDDSSGAIRLNLIKNGAFFAIQSLGFGVGAGNSEYYIANHAIYPVGGITKMHNWWMEILVNYGVIIFVGYVVLYLSILLKLWSLHKRAEDVTEKIICESLLVSWVSFFMASISSSSFITFSPQWIYLGFTIAFLNYAKIKNNKCFLTSNDHRNTRITNLPILNN
jgi:teichuronic acid biosynthesis protein TuaE